MSRSINTQKTNLEQTWSVTHLYIDILFSIALNSVHVKIYWCRLAYCFQLELAFKAKMLMNTFL